MSEPLQPYGAARYAVLAVDDEPSRVFGNEYAAQAEAARLAKEGVTVAVVRLLSIYRPSYTVEDICS
jgi:hypothetical protein